MEKTLEQIKDEVAARHNYRDWKTFEASEFPIIVIAELEKIAELFATQKAKEAWNRGYQEAITILYKLGSSMDIAAERLEEERPEFKPEL